MTAEFPLESSQSEPADNIPFQEAAKIRLSTLIASMQAAVLVEDEQRRVVLANQAFCDMFGIPIPPQDLIGVDCAESAEQSKEMFADPQNFVDRINTCISLRRPINSERVELADGRVFERDYVPVFFDAQYGGHLWQYRDITERERLMSELIRARDDAQSADRAKSAFLAMISHEIRTPLNAIMGMASLLLDTDLDSEQRGYSQAIRSSGEILLALLNNVLDFSKIEAGRMQIERVPFSPRESVESCIALLDPMAREHGLTLRAVIDPQIPDYVLGDLQRVRQVLINLISNAIKFTEQGSVIVHLWSRAQATGLQLEFAVIDTGIGMTAEQMQQLFQPFQQVTDSSLQRAEGAGLGLAISRRLSELMGGSLSVQSVLHKGSTFRLILPTIPTNKPERRPRKPGERQSSGKQAQTESSAPLRILVAEDNLLNQQVLLRMLNRSGYTADMVGDGKAALEAIIAKPYDLVFMDIHMPELDSLEVTRQVRTGLNREHQPFIVAVTAGASSGDRDRFLAAGMDEYLAKPVQRSELEMVLKLVASSIVRTNLEDVLLDPATLGELLNAIGSDEGLTSLIDLFRHDIGETMLNLRRFSEAGALDQVAEIAHRLKGSGLTIGATRFVTCCRNIESLKQTGDTAGLRAAIEQLSQVYNETLAALEIQSRKSNH